MARPDAETACTRQLPDVEEVLTSNLDTALTMLLDGARRLLRTRYAALGVLDVNRLQLERFLVSGLDDEQRRAIGAPPRGRGMLGLLIADPRPLRIDDVEHDGRSYGFPDGHPVMHSFLGVPVMIGDVPCGNLYFADKLDGSFDDADERIATVAAARASVMVRLARAHRLKGSGLT